MRKGPQKSLFPASVLTVTTLVVATFLSQGLRSSVPRIGAGTLREGTEDFLRAASNQDIPWQELSEEVFREAKLKDKPILMICGDRMDLMAQRIDEKVFLDREVTAWLKTSFICVRVDLAQRPEWRDVYLQVERGRAHVNPNWQGWMLLPNGKTFNRILLSGVSQLDARWFMPIVRSSVQRFREIQRGGGGVVPGEAQAKDRNFLIGSPAETPDTSRFGDYLEEYAQQLAKAAPVPAHFLPPTQQIQFLLITGRTEEATALLDRLLMSPFTDWVDGGVFQQALRMDWSEVAFQKSAVRVADFLSVLTIAYLRTQNPLYKYAADLAFSCLADRFRLGGFVRGSQFADMSANGHSPIYSVPFSELREGLTPAQRDTLFKFFPLNRRLPAQQTLVLNDVQFASENLAELAEVLLPVRLAKAGKTRYFGAEQQADVAGIAVARMSRMARLFQDHDKSDVASELRDKLETLLAGDSVLHSLRVLNEGHSTLKDALAVSDAMLEQYLLNGNLDSFERGLRILLAAMEDFSGPRDGVLVNWKPFAPENWPPDITTPGLVDSFGESSAAMAIRLANNYGKILRAIKIDDLGPAVGEKLAAFAETSVRVFSQPATRVGWNAAGYFCSAWRVLKGSVVLVKGPLAVDEATTLARRIPHRFVAPLVGQLTEGWSLKADGVYVVSPDGVAGPLTPDEVTGQLGG